MDHDNISQTIIEKEISDELIWITVSKYALFMSYGKIGIDAKALYEHYQFTCILQKTNSVWAADKYCRQGLDWGRDRFENAKRLLIDLGLIEINQIRNENGKFSKIYIKVKMKKVELEPVDLDRLTENRQADLPASGKTTTNALTKKINALTNNVKEEQYPPNYEEIFDYWNSKESLIKHKAISLFIKSFSYKKFKELNEYYSIEEIKKAIDNYNTILSSDKYFFNYKWSIGEFFSRANGIHKFFDSAEPLLNFKSNFNKTKEFKWEEFPDE